MMLYYDVRYDAMHQHFDLGSWVVCNAPFILILILILCPMMSLCNLIILASNFDSRDKSSVLHVAFLVLRTVLVLAVSTVLAYHYQLSTIVYHVSVSAWLIFLPSVVWPVSCLA
jgi:hypothetical protein